MKKSTLKRNGSTRTKFLQRQNYLLLLLLIISSFSYAQFKDTIVNINGKSTHYDYKTSWSKEKLKQEINKFKVDKISNAFKSSASITQILSQIPISQDACRNGGFEDDYSGWTGLSLKHQNSTIPIENGLITNPGILPLPFTGTGYGQNYTSIETTGLDPIISVASPPFNLQRTAPGTSGSKSLRLGNNAAGFGAEGVAKRFMVTAANSQYYFQYAIVMDRSHSNPDGSVNGSEVFFIAEATDLSGTTIDKIVDVANPSNPFINAVNSGSTYYRDWRCAYLDLSSHIGQEVVVMFINSDCSAGGHKGYTYIDDVCEECVSTEGDINLNLNQDNCLDFPELVGGTFTIPAGATNVNISLEIYQTNVLVNTLTSVTLTPPNYSFTLQPTDFPDQTDGACYDLVAVLTFDLIDLNGNLQTVTQLSSKVVNGVQDGEVPGLDNDVCFCEDEEGDSDYCCGLDGNLVENGNFEAGDMDFNSAYAVGANTLYGTNAGKYYVGTNLDGLSISPLWDVNDHSFCTIASTNDKVLFVNGKTTQPSGTESVIWEQNIVLNTQEKALYKFCANFKNMPQATFDILPKIEIRVTGGATVNSGFITINQNAADPCAWQLEGFDFTASGSVNIQIVLKEDEFNDGNDLAIDDISLQEMPDPEYSITVQHQGNPQVITASVDTISPTDDELMCDSDDYYWFVAEVLTYPSITIGPLSWGNNAGVYINPPGSFYPSATWNLTTQFPLYTFAQDTMYIIGLYTPPNPDCCVDESFTYQLTFNHRAQVNGVNGLSARQRQEIIDLLGVIGNGEDGGNERLIDSQEKQKVSVFPNPSNDYISIQSESKVTSFSISNIFGRVEITNKVISENNLNNISVTNLKKGVYTLTVITENGEKINTKFIKI